MFVFSYLSPGNDLPARYLRLLAPPLQLLSAAVWQVVQRGLVDHYGMLEEFVTMVTELVPELMSYSQRAQLILGLRARVSSVYCLMKQNKDFINTVIGISLVLYAVYMKLILTTHTFVFI